MSKPIADMTLREVKEMCANRDNCLGCPFVGNVCSRLDYGLSPSDWDLEEHNATY